MTFKEYFERLGKMQRWIIGDLTNSTVDARANFLVAMGVFNYIEMLGAFYEHENTRGYATRRFNFAFQDLLPNEYQNIFSSISALTNGVYDCLRCGMSHEYLVKTYRIRNQTVNINFTIYGVDNLAAYTNNVMDKDCGIELIQLGSNDYHLRIYNPRLIHDLNQAFEEFKKRLIQNKRGYRRRFLQRCKDIHFEKFN